MDGVRKGPRSEQYQCITQRVAVSVLSSCVRLSKWLTLRCWLVLQRKMHFSVGYSRFQSAFCHLCSFEKFGWYSDLVLRCCRLLLSYNIFLGILMATGRNVVRSNLVANCPPKDYASEATLRRTPRGRVGILTLCGDPARPTDCGRDNGIGCANGVFRVDQLGRLIIVQLDKMIVGGVIHLPICRSRASDFIIISSPNTDW